MPKIGTIINMYNFVYKRSADNFMKVLLVNGSPHKNGSTYSALREVETALNNEGIETSIVWLGTEAISGCLACGYCSRNGKCVKNDIVNEFAQRAKNADGFVFGTPVHFASASGAITSFLDRVFYSASGALRHKPAAVITVARRGGTTAAYDQLVKYPAYAEMPIISSNYWNMVHGAVASDVPEDKEGMQTMRILGKNMAYFIKCIEAGKKAGIELPQPEKKEITNFIR